MAVHINCTHCGALCQVDDSLLGNNVRCGRCSKVFVANAEEKASTGAPASSAGASAAVGKSIGSKLGSFFSGAKNMFQKQTAATEQAPVAKVEPESKATATESDEDIGIDFDEEGLDLMQKDAGEEQAHAPVLGDIPEPVHGLFRLDIGCCTSVGRVREKNEDSFLIQHQVWSNLDKRRDSALVIVADGMGGHEAGDRASKMTLQHVSSALGSILNNLGNPDGQTNASESFKSQLESAIKAANKAVFDVSQSEAGRKGMGSTAAVALIRDGQADIGHVGDCRVYHYRAGHLKQVTKDQTLVERMIDLGQLTREEAEEHETRNEVTQAVGIHANIEPGYYNLKLAPGDWLIVACDGLHAHVKSNMLAEALHAAPFSASLVAQYLVDMANHLGGSDNCTVVAVRCF